MTTPSNGRVDGMERGAWRRVTNTEPCPICAHDSWCSVGEFVVLCMRTDNNRPAKDGNGWLHPLVGQVHSPVRETPKPTHGDKPQRNWRAISDQFENKITNEQVEQLAKDLGVGTGSLRELGIGWNDAKHLYTFPMYGADGSASGIRTRNPDTGEKKAVFGSKLGVIKCRAPVEGSVLLCEGESDTAAALSIGFQAIGLPGAGMALDAAAAHLHGVDVVVVADADEAGASGAERACRKLSGIAKSVVIIVPPAPHKDLRVWVRSGATRDDVKALITNAERSGPPILDCDGVPPGTQEEEPQKKRELIPYGTRDPADGKYVLSARRTIPTARAFVAHFYMSDGVQTLHAQSELVLAWNASANCYCEVEDGALRKQTGEWLHEAKTYVYDKRTKQIEFAPFDSNPATVRSAIETVTWQVHLPATVPAPCWLDPAAARFSPNEIVSCRTHNLHIPTREEFAPTPALFTTFALDFDYDANAPTPEKWLQFLDEVFVGDTQAIDLLHEWFGYSVSGDTSQQKMLLIVGPRRSGKGTIARVLSRLVGPRNVAGPTVGSLASNFGLQPLLGKSLAIVSDARFSGQDVGIVVERLLCISGEDAISVDRKFLPSVTTKLPTRLVFLTNELPRLLESSTALAGRFLVLQTRKSFYGAEDTGLTDKLLGEMPGIFKWALDGRDHLRTRGRFTEPESSRAAVQELEDLSSPVGAFVRERCIVGPGHRVLLAQIYEAWKAWCEQDGRTTVTSRQMFGRDLAAAVPGVTRRRGTDLAPFYEGIGLA